MSAAVGVGADSARVMLQPACSTAVFCVGACSAWQTGMPRQGATVGYLPPMSAAVEHLFHASTHRQREQPVRSK